jgi:hypothetical protein
MMQEPNKDLSDRVGVLLYDNSVAVDAMLADSVQRIRESGIRVSGLLQRFGHRLTNGKRSMWLRDIATGKTLRLDRPATPDTAGLLIDPAALTRAAALMRRAIASGADLVVVNRFGKAEADGAGLRAEIAAAIGSGAIVLIPVRFTLLDDLEGFLGSTAPLVLPSADAIVNWSTHAAGRRFATAS